MILPTEVDVIQLDESVHRDDVDPLLKRARRLAAGLQPAACSMTGVDIRGAGAQSAARARGFVLPRGRAAPNNARPQSPRFARDSRVPRARSFLAARAGL
jgi:hypothetical protein